MAWEGKHALKYFTKIFQEETEDFTAIGTLVALIVTERHFTNADINNWIQEEFHVESKKEQMELSDTEWDDLYSRQQHCMN